MGISEKDIIQLSEEGKIPAYKIGGVYLRFKKEQLDRTGYRKESMQRIRQTRQYSLLERFSDFFYFYDFYVLSGILIVIMLYVIFRT